MDLSKLTVQEIKAWVKQQTVLSLEEIAWLEADSRQTVQQLAKSARRQFRSYQQVLARERRLLRLRQVLHQRGYQLVAGVDEAGRGPLAGPVVAAAVILPRGITISGLNDSKQLTPAQREELYQTICQTAEAVGVGIGSVEDIDTFNIRTATVQAMARAVERLRVQPDFCLVDGDIHISGLEIPQRAVVRGDTRCDVVAAASVVAKVTRDRLLLELDRQYPQYGFAVHKGYATPSHLRALRQYGPSPVHRYSFAPVRQMVPGAPIRKSCEVK